MQAFIEQQKRWNREKNIIAAESRQKAIDRMEKIDRPKYAPDKINFKFRSSITSGKDVLFVENMSKEYPGKPLFDSITFRMERNERVFILGPNGCGKSTFLKILAGRLKETAGSFEYGHNVELGYYDQEQETLTLDKTVIDEVWDSNEKLTQTEIRNSLAMFLFKGEDVFKPVSILSGGEKSRGSLLKFMLSRANFLILDEPTNHLDINSREVLENSLSDFDGTLLIVSHDRYFIDKLATRIIELDKNHCIDYKGNYSDYQSYKAGLGSVSSESSEDTGISYAKLEHLAVKEERAKKRRLEKQLTDTENEIAYIEDHLQTISEQMQQEEVLSDHVRLLELNNEQDKLNKRLEELYELWEKLMC